MSDEALDSFVEAFDRDARYKIVEILKESDFESTAIVTCEGIRFIRKTFKQLSGIGSTYELIHQEQQRGKAFTYVPRIIECYNLQEQDVAIMEYIDGETLETKLATRRFTGKEASKLFSEICNAVIELHSVVGGPVIHRDIKPSNIMVSKSSVKLIDFGIARAFSKDAAHDTQYFGTRTFAPPEQFGYGQTDVRSDVYALGMVFYALFAGKTASGNLSKQELTASIPDARVRVVVQKATAFDPSDRYQTVIELREASKSKWPWFWKLGVAWNCVIAANWMFFWAVSMWMTFAPTPDDPRVGFSLGRRFILYNALMFLVLAPVAYVLAYKPPLRARISLIRKPRLVAEIALGVACFIIGCIIIAILG